MKKLTLLIFLLILSNCLYAQVPCEYSVNVKDSLGTYKSTKEYLLYEKNFGGDSNYIFASLSTSDGTPILNLQFIQKSKQFIKANCFDQNSKIYLQLDNGKIITLLHLDQENCGSMVRDENGFDNRILVGKFMFLKGTIDDLKSSPVNLMRVKFLTNINDYLLRKEILAEVNGNTYQPENYFVNYLKCVQ